MIYHGFQFRMARAVLGHPTTLVCRMAQIGKTSLQKIEEAGLVEVGIKQGGKFEPGTIARLTAVYKALGITFLKLTRTEGAGVRYRPLSEEDRLYAQRSTRVKRARRLYAQRGTRSKRA